MFAKLVCLRTRPPPGCIISTASCEAPVLVTEDAVYEIHLLYHRFF